MKTNPKQLIIYAALAGLVWICGETFAAEKPSYPRVENGVKIVCHIYDQVVREGRDARFRVAAESDAPDQGDGKDYEGKDDLVYQWYKHKRPLKDGDRISGATNSVLTVKKVERADVGFYLCHIRKKLNDGKLGEPVIVYGHNPDAPDPEKAPAQLFVVRGEHTVISGAYVHGAGSLGCILSYQGKTVFPAPRPPPASSPYPGDQWHVRPGGGGAKVKIDDQTPGATSNGGSEFTAKVQIWESPGLARPCAVDNVQYNSVKTWETHGYAYKFTTYVTSWAGGSPPSEEYILDLDINWNAP